MPVEPEWRSITAKPIISRTSEHQYVVTEEYVERSVQEHKWVEAVKLWKRQNEIR